MGLQFDRRLLGVRITLKERRSCLGEKTGAGVVCTLLMTQEMNLDGKILIVAFDLWQGLWLSIYSNDVRFSF